MIFQDEVPLLVDRVGHSEHVDHRLAAVAVAVRRKNIRVVKRGPKAHRVYEKLAVHYWR